MSQPKLLVLTSTLPRWRGDTEPEFVQSLALELARHFDVTILAPHYRGAALSEVVTDNGRTVAIRRFRYFIPRFQSLAYDGGMLPRLRQNPLRWLLVPLFLVSQLVAVASLNRRNGFDVCHAHWIIPQGLVAAVYARMNRRAPPFVLTSHGSDLYALRGALARRLQAWTIDKARRVTVVSEAMRSHAETLGIGAEKIVVRSMGVDLQHAFTPPVQERDRNGLIFVGRLVEVKGLAYLIDAVGQLIEKYPTLQLQVIGDGPLRRQLEGWVSDRQLQDHIRFSGSVEHSELPGILRNAQAAVMPSIVTEAGEQEGMGLVAVEAMGCGCPVIASDLPAIRHTISDGKTGLLARPADAADLAAKIDKLLSDGELGNELSRNARQHAVDNFDWRMVGDTYADLLRNCIND